MTHTKNNILQYNACLPKLQRRQEYYPFGLQTANSWTREDASNKYLYNGGNELNENSGWYETFFRGYDAALGRFMQVDPLASLYNSHSPYHFAYNNPVMFNDPFGVEADSTGTGSGGNPFNWFSPQVQNMIQNAWDAAPEDGVSISYYENGQLSYQMYTNDYMAAGDGNGNGYSIGNFDAGGVRSVMFGNGNAV